MTTYEERILARASALQQNVIHVDERTKATQERIEKLRSSMEKELREAGETMLELSEETTATVERVKHLAERFHAVVKKGDLQRLQQRVDRWAPENKISRDMFRRLMNSP